MKDDKTSGVITDELQTDHNNIQDDATSDLVSKDEKSVSSSRRKFLGGIGAAPFAISALSMSTDADATSYYKYRKDKYDRKSRFSGALTPWARDLRGRAKRAARIRINAALRQLKRNSNVRGRDNFLRTHKNNGDEKHLQGFIGNFTKGLPHNDLGEVDPKAYRALQKALSTGKFSDLAKVPLGCADPTQQRRLVNPLAGIAWQGLGPDSHAQTVPPAPNLSSKEAAAETVEVYWGALLRDVPFDQYEGNPIAEAAVDELNSMAGKGDMKDVKGTITTKNLFRSGLPGADKGPFTSQFMLKDVPYGAQPYDQTIVSRVENVDFMSEYDEWLDIQRGCAQGPGKELFDPVRRYYYNGRSAASYVQVDALAQAYFNACIIMLTPPTSIGQFGMNAGAGGIGAPFDPNNPYFGSAVGGGVGDSSGFLGAARISEGLATFGPPQILTLLWEVSGKVAQNQWFQKWNVHRRLRPEAYGGRVHNVLRGAADYPLHSSILDSKAVDMTKQKFGSWLLPMAFPEGSPTHPSYGAGHASVAGACVTVLKAVFDENAVIANPVQPSADGTKLVPYTGGDELTVGGELNKLAGNIGCARNFGCVHWRSDNAVSYRLGEEFAIQYMKDLAETTNEPFGGFELTTFDGKKVIV